MPGLCGSELSTDWIFSFIPPSSCWLYVHSLILYRLQWVGVDVFFLVIPPKSARPREAGWLDEGAPEILRGAQDDSLGFCHPEHREGSLANFWGITSFF